MAPAQLRAGRDEDAAGFIALIDACWAEYPGCVLDIDGEVPELRALATYFADAGGALFAAEADGVIVGMAATRPAADGAWELCKMYVALDQRGTGVAARLLATTLAHAMAHGAATMTLWTDTRFERAHRFYEKHGFVRQGAPRELGDKSHSVEYPYLLLLARGGQAG
jgi:GNAT superfamily N-acetyltransferase